MKGIISIIFIILISTSQASSKSLSGFSIKQKLFQCILDEGEGETDYENGHCRYKKYEEVFVNFDFVNSVFVNLPDRILEKGGRIISSVAFQVYPEKCEVIVNHTLILAIGGQVIYPAVKTTCAQITGHNTFNVSSINGVIMGGHENHSVIQISRVGH